MYAKKIKYEDFNGMPHEETFMFNLTPAELAELQLSESGGLVESLQRMAETEDTPKMFQQFKRLILKAYGEKSADGKYFIKFDEDGHPLSAKFAQSAAYSAFFLDLCTNADAAKEFLLGAIPANLRGSVADALAKVPDDGSMTAAEIIVAAADMPT